MINKLKLSIVSFCCALAVSTAVYALTVGDVTTDTRAVDGNMVSDYDPNPPAPVFGSVFGTGNVTITFAEVLVDTNGGQITPYNYEIRYRVVGTTVYTVAAVPAQYTGYAFTASTGSYEGNIVAVDTGGNVSAPSNFTFEVL